MVFDLFNKERTQSSNKKEKEARIKAEQAEADRVVREERTQSSNKKEKEARIKAEQAEADRVVREKKYCTLDEILKNKPFSKQTLLAFRKVTVSESNTSVTLVELVPDSGARYYIYNRISQKMQQAVSKCGKDSYFVFSAFSTREITEALNCILPEFSPTHKKYRGILENGEYESYDPMTNICPHVSPKGAKASDLVLRHGLSTATLWQNQKNRICSKFKITYKIYDCYLKRFEKQADEFSEILSADEHRFATQKDINTEADEYAAEIHTNEAENKCRPEECPTELDLLSVLSMLRSISPFEHCWNKCLAFRVLSFDIDNQDYPVIELIISRYGERYSDYVPLLYHELPNGMDSKIDSEFKPHGTVFSSWMIYMPVNIEDVISALSQIMPQFNGYSVHLENKNSRCRFKKDQLTPDLIKPITLIAPEKLVEVDSLLSDWFFAVQEYWRSPSIMQLLKMPVSEYNYIMDVYRPYETVHEQLLQQRIMDQKTSADEARKKEDKMIQRAGTEGEKKVDYVLTCMGADTIRIKDNTVNKSGNSCIMLKSAEWANYPQEYDHIIIRENGVFLIETKNYSGKIAIDKSGNWTQTKNQQELITNAIESPTFQVYRHEKLIRSFLQNDVPVRSIICLANPRVLVSGQEYCKVPVLRADLLAQFIEEQPSPRMLSREEMEDIHKLITAHYYEYPADDTDDRE